MVLKTIAIILAFITTRIICQEDYSDEEYSPKIPQVMPKKCDKKRLCSKEDFEEEGIEIPEWDEWWSQKLDGLTTQPDLETIELEHSWEPALDSYEIGKDDCESYPVQTRSLRFLKYDSEDDYWIPAAYSPNAYEQVVFIQECKNEDAKCFNDLKIDNGARAKCGQEYTHIMVKTWIDGNVTAESYELPTYCSCKLERN